MRLQVERDRCVGAGMCNLAAPEVFDQDDEEGQVILLDAAPPEDLHPVVREAVATCPSGAISMSESPEGEVP
jgi:ferredoxin